MAESAGEVREVLYEERRHASRPFSSDCLPLSLQRSNGADKGGFLSFLSARGVSQLKEKWIRFKNPKKMRKPVSLFISPRGERVAVAAGNQVTILRKEDDYQEPCGIFTIPAPNSFYFCNCFQLGFLASDSSLVLYACGAWSESHDILGIVDDADVIYFIKANGEEITRITKRHLKISSTVIGLLAENDFEVQQSFFFTVLTSDGAFHHIEISQESSASISSVNESGLALKRQFPQNVFCFDYYPELSLLLVVGSITASGKSEGFSSEDRFDSSNSNRRTDDLHHGEQTPENRSNQPDISRMRWNLVSLSERSVPEMFKILIGNSKHQAALEFSDRYQLDRDEVLKSQWLCSNQGINDLNTFLSNIKDKAFVLSECVDKVGPSEEAVKALLAYGLQLTNFYKFSEQNNQKFGEIWDFRLARLQLLQFSDRLETFLGINMGRFSVQEYSKFRVMPIDESAIALAESGKIGALNLLFKRHPYSLAPFMLDILDAIPETIPVRTYVQLLPGRFPPRFFIREEDWVECDKMICFISNLPENQDIDNQIRTEPIVKQLLGSFWPSTAELAFWYKHRARDIDSYSGLLDNCLSLVGFACQKGVNELKQFHEDISYLHQLVYANENDAEISTSMSLVAWEQLSDYEKFRTMLDGCREENVVESLWNKAIPFMQKRSRRVSFATQEQIADGHSQVDRTRSESFLVRWLKEMSLVNKLDVCLMVIEEGCRELQSSGFFKDEVEVVDCALQCLYLFTVTDRWSTMAAILSKLPHKQDSGIFIGNLDQRCKVAEGHIEAGSLLAFYQVPKPMSYFLEAHSDEKGVKQIIRLILSKFIRQRPGRSDNEWADLWHDMQCLHEEAFTFLNLEYLLTEFCGGLLKAEKFSLARSYLKGTSSVALATEKAENLVIQAAREFFFSASSLAGSEIWKAKDCLNLFPSSRNVKAEADFIDALTVKLPNLGVTLLPMQFQQIKDPMEIIKMAIRNKAEAYLHVDELIEVAKLLGLSSLDEISGVQEAIAREAAVTGDLQLAYDLCLVLAKRGYGIIWDLCAAIARGPSLENLDTSSRKQLLGFALSHCDEESIGELLHAWKDLDMQVQCETLMTLTGIDCPSFSVQGSSVFSLPDYSIQDIVDLAKSPAVHGTDWELLLQENGKILSFAAVQLPWLLELTRKPEHCKKFTSGMIPGKQYVSVRTQVVITILSWLARNDFAPRDDLIASLVKSIIEPPVTEEEDVIGCSFLLNLVDAFSGVELIEEQLKTRENYLETCSIKNVPFRGGSCSSGSLKRRIMSVLEFIPVVDRLNKTAQFCSNHPTGAASM
ncbi:Neuroblastoma-amplified sequence [Gossypium arboreum]|uniref:Neuroblastoma-amplified sequence n=1 Tax=Gossypium arboreum TaxID=29729 RepID=A0A0B0PE74_GOSAR|nr:Neuroblastoma-amplified sequence [Gossypium arboreum]